MKASGAFCDNTDITSRYHSSADKADYRGVVLGSYPDDLLPLLSGYKAEIRTEQTTDPVVALIVDGNGKTNRIQSYDNRMSKGSFHWKIFICFQQPARSAKPGPSEEER
ncbi:hypothetical protein Trydic_g18925 [Trypoxylus dichotomus]